MENHSTECIIRKLLVFFNYLLSWDTKLVQSSYNNNILLILILELLFITFNIFYKLCTLEKLILFSL